MPAVVRALAFPVLALLAGSVRVASAQGPSPSPPWTVSPSLMIYAVPDEGSFLQPSVSADRGRLHVEGRYNYEDRDTGSAWLGVNARGGSRDAWWEVTPMVGVVLGRTTGVAPGYRGAVGWKRLALASEGEYVFDTEDPSASFFYNWSEATVSPLEGLRVGVAAQRTRVYASSTRDVQRGLVVGTSFGSVDASLYVFNPGARAPIVIVSVAVRF